LSASNSASRLRQVAPDREFPEAGAAPAPASRVTLEAAGLQMILLGLKALGQRAVVALATIATAAGLASVWFLFWQALPADPSVHQLVTLGMYALFVLAVFAQTARK